MIIVECLKAGELKINPTKRQLEIAGGQLIVPYDKIKPSEWGYVYEKYVGQILENEGFTVTYNGFKGYSDRGVDLIAEKGESITYIQCKYKNKGKLCKSHIDNNLYKASKKLLEEYQGRGKKLAFALFVHSRESNFTRRRSKGSSDTLIISNKIEYPWLEYFLSQNHTQSKVKVGFRELPMDV